MEQAKEIATKWLKRAEDVFKPSGARGFWLVGREPYYDSEFAFTVLAYQDSALVPEATQQLTDLLLETDEEMELAGFYTLTETDDGFALVGLPESNPDKRAEADNHTAVQQAIQQGTENFKEVIEAMKKAGNA